jgi:hypothetical protein
MEMLGSKIRRLTADPHGREPPHLSRRRRPNFSRVLTPVRFNSGGGQLILLTR